MANHAEPVSGNLGVGTWIERRARVAPHHPALIAAGLVITYAELASRVRRLAGGLRRLGVGHGDRVAWLGPNHPAFLESLFATGLLGAAFAPVNHRLASDEVLGVLADTEPRVSIVHAGARLTIPASVGGRVVVVDTHGKSEYEQLIAASIDEPGEIPVGFDDLCLLPHTSGTTGAPKGVMLTHGNVTWNVVNFLSCADFRTTDVTIAIAPFFRVGGTGVNVLPVLFVGGTVVVTEDLSADEVLRLMERHGVTVGFGNPDVLGALLASPLWRTTDLSSVRFVLTGGAPVPERLIRAYLERGVTLLQGYGLSEAAPLALLLDAESALEKIGSAGRPPLLVDIQIVDADGRTVASGDTGELLVRGPNVMAGYWRRPSDTREVLGVDGWLRTGDAARMDGDGFVWIVDRYSDRYLSRGHTVYPGDVERVLMTHPAIADAGVVGIPSPRDGETGAAFIVVSPGAAVTEQELLAFSRDRLLPHESPSSIKVVDALPRSSVGKLLRDVLRARAASSES